MEYFKEKSDGKIMRWRLNSIRRDTSAGHWLSEVGKERMIQRQKGKPVAALSAAFQLLA